jgi:LysM repeat protein
MRVNTAQRLGSNSGIDDMIRTRFSDFRSLAANFAQTAAVLAIAGCASTQSPERAATSPAAPAAPSATVSTARDARGIVTYDGYQAAVARSGDTVASVAQRIGMSASKLGAYNGLSPTHPLRPGDEMVLPPRSDGYSAGARAAVPLDTGAAAGATDAGAADPAASDGVGWSPDLAAAAIERASGEVSALSDRNSRAFRAQSTDFVFQDFGLLNLSGVIAYETDRPY